jgi:hypothetical protein
MHKFNAKNNVRDRRKKSSQETLQVFFFLFSAVRRRKIAKGINVYF